MMLELLPTHCFSCGVFLMGGATRHKPHCVMVLDSLCLGHYIEKGEDGSSITVHKDGPVWVCMACPFSEMGWNVAMSDLHEVLFHLGEHVGKGHTVPDSLYTQLANEAIHAETAVE